MHTKDFLAQELRAAGLNEMADKAATGYYHDYLSPLDVPCIQLMDDLKAVGAIALMQRHANGEFDASIEEGDEWIKSPEGQEALKGLGETREVREQIKSFFDSKPPSKP